MRVALVSDLHGNQYALDAVLADVARVGVDRLVCLGDVATLGARPREVLATLRDAGCATILGNHDDFLLDPQLIHTYTEFPVVIDAVDWCREQLGADDLAFVRTFVPGLDVELEGGVVLRLYHGSPRSHMEDLLATTPADQLDAALAGGATAVMAGGHTHYQMLRQHRGVLLVNPGSVGAPFKEFVAGQGPLLMDHAEYATVEARGGAVEVVLRRVPLERRRLYGIADAAAGHPLRRMWLQQYG